MMINNENLYCKAIRLCGDYAYSYTAPLSSFEDIDWVFDSPSKSDVELKYEELQAAEPMRLLRVERDRLIAATDWWVLPDRTPTQAQIEYRGALRDLPANSPNATLDENGQLINVTWPTPPK